MYKLNNSSLVIAVFADELLSILEEIGKVIPFMDRLPLVVIFLDEAGDGSTAATSSISIIFFRLRNGLHSVLVVSFIEAEDLKINCISFCENEEFAFERCWPISDEN